MRFRELRTSGPSELCWQACLQEPPCAVLELQSFCMIILKYLPCQRHDLFDTRTRTTSNCRFLHLAHTSRHSMHPSRLSGTFRPFFERQIRWLIDLQVQFLRLRAPSESGLWELHWQARLQKHILTTDRELQRFVSEARSQLRKKLRTTETAKFFFWSNASHVLHAGHVPHAVRVHTFLISW